LKFLTSWDKSGKRTSLWWQAIHLDKILLRQTRRTRCKK